MINDEIINRLKLLNCRNPLMKDAKDSILFYISGFNVRKIIPKIEC